MKAKQIRVKKIKAKQIPRPRIGARQILLVLFIAGLAIKLVPPLANDFLVDYDSIYHTRIGQIVAETGWVPWNDPAMGGRPHLYPPAYHLLLGYLSKASGMSVFDLIQCILPFVSALLIVPAFFLIKKFRGGKTALWGAAFMAFSPIITSQSYDSPHLFGLLLFPLIVYWFLKGRYYISGGLLAVCVLFNYGIVLTILSVLVVFSVIKLRKGEKRYVICAGLTAVIGLGLASPWLLISASRASECFEPSVVVSTINDPGIPYLWKMVPFVLVIGGVLIYATRNGARFAGNKEDDYLTLWRAAFGIATIAFMISLFIPQLHPYDQILLFGFSMPFLLAELRLRKEYKAAIIAIMVVGMLLSIAAVKPALTNSEVAAAKWVAENGDGTVLANLEMSGAINMFAASSPRITTSFDQFLECIPDRERWTDLHEALKTSDTTEALALLKRWDVNYVVIGPRDAHYGFDTGKFASMDLQEVFKEGDVKVYALGANQGSINP